MHTKKHLGFKGLRNLLSDCINDVKDHRQPGKVNYSLYDCMMSAFAMMYLQDPALLEFQRRQEEDHQKNNLINIFKIKSTPKDTQFRDVVDRVDSEQLMKVFPDYFFQLQRGKHLEGYRFIDGKYLITLDGSEYFSSEKIHCSSCLTKTSKKGEVRYHHQILQAALVHPSYKQVFPLAPEAIKNTDGVDKQDCEINAGKRIIKKISVSHPKKSRIPLRT